MKHMSIIAALLASSCAMANRTYSASTCVGDGVPCFNRLASTQCPNGANDYHAYRDARGRLHIDAGCD